MQTETAAARRPVPVRSRLCLALGVCALFMPGLAAFSPGPPLTISVICGLAGSLVLSAAALLTAHGAPDPESCWAGRTLSGFALLLAAASMLFAAGVLWAQAHADSLFGA